MFHYTNVRTGIDSIDDAQNGLSLRADVHSVFDQKKFAIVPKAFTLVCHVVIPDDANEIMNLYHNVKLLSLIDVKIEFFYLPDSLGQFSFSFTTSCSRI